MYIEYDILDCKKKDISAGWQQVKYCLALMATRLLGKSMISNPAAEIIVAHSLANPEHTKVNPDLTSKSRRKEKDVHEKNIRL